MVGKTKIDIFSNMSKSELKEAMHQYVTPYRTYQRLNAMKLLSEGYSYDMVAHKMGKSYQTIHRWAKNCEKFGINGLKPNFDGGRPSKLTEDEIIKLDELIRGYDKISVSEVRELILKEFNVEYSKKQVWAILTQKLDYKCQNSKVIPL